MSNENRRNFLKTGLGAAGAVIASGLLSKADAAETCGLTPPQTQGPFYPGETNFKTDNDLTVVPGRGRAQGQLVYVRGRVLDPLCRPIANANVEIWQACHTGKYNHANDPNPAKLDPNFKYWAETFTDAKGFYIFKTILPGAYPAGQGWVRPPHIHYRVAALGYRELVTQMYFAGHRLNSEDLILQDLPPAERDRVTVSFQSGLPGFETDAWVGNFDVTLSSIR